METSSSGDMKFSSKRGRLPTYSKLARVTIEYIQANHLGYSDQLHGPILVQLPHVHTDESDRRVSKEELAVVKNGPMKPGPSSSHSPASHPTPYSLQFSPEPSQINPRAVESTALPATNSVFTIIFPMTT